MQQIPRLFVPGPLAPAASVQFDARQAHYLQTVLRLGVGARVCLLDDATGEWAAELCEVARRRVVANVGAQLRPRECAPDLWLLAAPLRPERFQWVAEKATELGVRRFGPVRTARVNHARQSAARLRAHMVEAAEQCERTALPELAEMRDLDALLAEWPAGRQLLFADEEGGQPMPALAPQLPAAILIGPEGGFTAAERAAILAQPQVRRLSLGGNILRADTAAVAAIAQFQLVVGAANRRKQLA